MPATHLTNRILLSVAFVVLINHGITCTCCDL